MNLRNKLMLGCMALLVLVTAVIFVRVTVSQVVIKKLHIDNVATRAVMFDLPFIYDQAQAKLEVAVPWTSIYPFAEDRSNAYTRWTAKVHSFEARLRDVADRKVGMWTGERLPFGYPLIELGRAYDNIIGWRVHNPALNAYKLEDGYLTFIYNKADMTERVEAVTELRDYAANYGAQLMFVQALYKVNKYGDAEVNGIMDFANQNADELLAGLDANGVKTLDLRQAMGENLTNAEYHELFFRTDHHWKMSSALTATSLIANELSDMGIAVDKSHLTPDSYTIENFPNSFLGSQGKKVTLVNTEVEDFALYHPRFSSQVHFAIPNRALDVTGDFDVFYDMTCVGKSADVYNKGQYSAYAYGDNALVRADNLLLDSYPEQKVLLIRDSYCDPVVPFLSMGVKHLITLDMRHFYGSLRTFIAQEKPDVIIVMYTPGYSEKLNPNSTEFGPRKFNFR